MRESEILRQFKERKKNMAKKKKKTAKKAIVRRCSGCGGRGHNVRTCQGN